MKRAAVIIGRFFGSVPLEALVWGAALVYLGLHDPSQESQFTLCPLKNLGLDFCPGCGLGRSISFFLHGCPVLSFHIHPLGIPATIILVARSVELLTGRSPQSARHPQ